ncbi:hypothetical protein GGR57DRAFT_496647 [Xylariaceae sp. FL1272]|nr:hypothetical protein GGR57DRAFT_496647 [Xylariaceae sp. FL1272]
MMISTGLCVARGALRRPTASRIFSRNNFSGRPARQKPTSALPSTPARTRFAPSPTGYVHIGSLRTALFNYLLAKATGGQFLLRLEDTDQKRLVPDAEEKLYQDLKWAGLNWDEGPDVGGPCGPYKQSERLSKYAMHSNLLLVRGEAYRCFCSPEELDTMKKLALEENRDPVYNGKCSHISAEESHQRAANGEEHCVRLKSPAKAPSVSDLVYGTYKSPVPLDDFIVMKRDGFPTYHFANVIDDHLMGITHVIRGAEWLVSTPRHVALYNKFGWEPPKFAHVGLLVDKNKQKLSKRFGGFNLSTWKDEGILPVALLNYVLLMGWSPAREEGGNTSEVMNMKEMIEKFHLKFTKGDVTVNNKNVHFQKAHARQALVSGLNDEAIAAPILNRISNHIIAYEKKRTSPESQTLEQEFEVPSIGPLRNAALVNPPAGAGDLVISPSYLKTLLLLSESNLAKPTDFIKKNIYMLWDLPELAHQASLQKHEAILPNIRISCKDNAGTEIRIPIKVSELTEDLLRILDEIPAGDWSEENISEAITPMIKPLAHLQVIDKVVKAKAWGWEFLRWVLNASVPGPQLKGSMAVLGKEDTLARVKQAHAVAMSMR